MEFIVLAAGLGSRLRPITNKIPKPLIEINGKPILKHILDSILPLASHVHINTFWLSEQIKDYIVENYSSYPITIYDEGKERLETGGGIFIMQAKVKKNTFTVINADVFTDYNFSSLNSDLDNKLGHLILVETPSFKKQGDFCLSSEGHLVEIGEDRSDKLTYSGICTLDKKLLEEYYKKNMTKVFSLTKALIIAIKNKQITGEFHAGIWHDIGSKESLALLNKK